MAAESARRRPLNRTRVGRPRIWMTAPPWVPPEAMFAFVVPMLPAPEKFGSRLVTICSTSPAWPERATSWSVSVSTFEGVTSSAVGMLDPVTTTVPAVAVTSPPGAGAGFGFLALTLIAINSDIPAAAAKAGRKDVNVLRTLLIIGFSMVWLGLG